MSPMPLRQGMSMRCEALPETAKQIAAKLTAHKFIVRPCGQSERLLPNNIVEIANPNYVERRLDGGISPKVVSVFEIVIPKEKPPHQNEGYELATKESCEERKRRLYQSKRAIVGL